MGRIIPTDIKDPFEQLPAGTFLFTVSDAAEGMVGKEGNEVYGVQVVHTVIEPQSHAGMEHQETFFIGVNAESKQVKDGKLQEDPNAEQAATWQMRGGQFKKYCGRHGLNIEGADLDVVLQTLVSKQILGKAIHVPSKTAFRDDGTPMINVRIDRWFAPGEATPAVDPVQPAAPVASPSTGPKPAGPAAGPRPVGAAAAQPPPPQAPPARPALRRLSR